MILQHNKNGLSYYEVDLGSICYIHFDLSVLILSLPENIKNECLTQLN